MSANLLRFITLAIVIYSSVSVAFSYEKEQVKLDQACEADRQTALKPRKSEIYQECRQKFKKSKSVCKQEANVYNGNRINGAPLFYELPTCEKAFIFRKKHADQ
jgi:hypothetical protein